jgi:hypothetical protein
MKSAATPTASDRSSKFRPQDPASRSRRRRELAREFAAGVPAWTPDDGESELILRTSVARARYVARAAQDT